MARYLFTSTLTGYAMDERRFANAAEAKRYRESLENDKNTMVSLWVEVPDGINNNIKRSWIGEE